MNMEKVQRRVKADQQIKEVSSHSSKWQPQDKRFESFLVPRKQLMRSKDSQQLELCFLAELQRRTFKT
jgi:hypothetical protein